MNGKMVKAFSWNIFISLILGLLLRMIRTITNYNEINNVCVCVCRYDLFRSQLMRKGMGITFGKGKNIFANILQCFRLWGL